VRFCTECGASLQQPPGKFCVECGHKFPNTTDETIVQSTTGTIARDASQACELAYTAMEQEKFDEAMDLVRPWAEQGDDTSLRYAVTLSHLIEGIDAARVWAQVAQAAGSLYPIVLFALSLEEDGKDEEAQRWYRIAADGGNAGAAAFLGFQAAEHGDLVEARKWFALCLASATAEEVDIVERVQIALSEIGH